MCKILTRKQFDDIFNNSIREKFGCKIYFNNKNLKKDDMYIENLRGCTFNNSVIVLKYTKNTFDLLNTLLHELGHYCLHSNKEIKDYGEHIKEYEAETLAKEVFNLLGLEEKYKEEYYVKEAYKKASLKDKKIFKKYKRQLKINDLAKQIADLLSSKIDLINDLNDVRTENKRRHAYNTEEQYKYKVTCTCCGKSNYYKRKGKVINNINICWCNACGKENGKLIVEEL